MSPEEEHRELAKQIYVALISKGQFLSQDACPAFAKQSYKLASIFMKYQYPEIEEANEAES